jgi:hypothetical protein
MPFFKFTPIVQLCTLFREYLKPVEKQRQPNNILYCKRGFKDFCIKPKIPFRQSGTIFQVNAKQELSQHIEFKQDKKEHNKLKGYQAARL